MDLSNNPGAHRAPCCPLGAAGCGQAQQVIVYVLLSLILTAMGLQPAGQTMAKHRNCAHIVTHPLSGPKYRSKRYNKLCQYLLQVSSPDLTPGYPDHRKINGRLTHSDICHVHALDSCQTVAGEVPEQDLAIWRCASKESICTRLHKLAPPALLVQRLKSADQSFWFTKAQSALHGQGSKAQLIANFLLFRSG